MAKLLKKVRQGLGWGKYFGYLNFSFKKDMREALNFSNRDLHR